jgi:hypothetical protein
MNEYFNNIKDETSEYLTATVLDNYLNKGRKIARKLPIAKTGFAIEDAVNGVNTGKKLFGEGSIRGSIAGGIGGLAHGASFGIIPKEESILGLGRLLGDKPILKPTPIKLSQKDIAILNEVLPVY